MSTSFNLPCLEEKKNFLKLPLQKLLKEKNHICKSEKNIKPQVTLNAYFPPGSELIFLSDSDIFK